MVGGLIQKTKKLAPVNVPSLINVHHLIVRAGLVGLVSVLNDWMGYHVYLRHG